MRPPEEILLRSLLPCIRGLLAYNLRSKGFSQSRIAWILGVSQAAVSGYLSKPPTRYAEMLREMDIPQDEIDLLIRSLLSAALEGPQQLTHALTTTWRRLLIRGYICPAHRKLYPELEGCEICLSGEERLPEEREAILNDLTRASKIMENSSELLVLYPEVSINLAMAVADASSLNDVAAFPGRIVKVGGRLVPVSKPAFGVSKHLASILLGTLRLNPSRRCVMNLRLVEGLEDAARRAGLDLVATEPNSKVRSEDDVVRDVIDALKARPGADLAIDAGGIGLEPSIYVFGETPIRVVEKARLLARTLLGLKSSGTAWRAG